MAKGGAVDGPESASIRARMEEAKVDSVSKLHPLYGKTVQIGDYGGIPDVSRGAPGGPAVIFYAVGDLFIARMENGREPHGNISGIVTAADGSLSYEFPEGV